MRKILTLSIMCLVLTVAKAQHSLQQLVMKVELRQDGSAMVTELRKMQIGTQGTEGFITFNDMGDIEVTDLKVTDDQGTDYAVEEKWDTERSRSEKKGRCGYNRTSKGVELCWGIGDSGDRIYKIQYTLTNLVKSYNDYDGFCHSFYEADLPAQKALVDIRLENGDSLTRDNAAVWTFGYHGYKTFKDGSIRAFNNDDPLKKGDAIIVLLQLNKGVLAPAVQKDASFKETVKRTALEGSDYNLEDAGLETGASLAKDGTRSNGIAQLKGDELPEEDEGPDIGLVVGVLVVIGIIVAAVIATKRDEKKWKKLCKEKLAWVDSVMGGKTYDEMPYYRDLPMNGNLLMSGAVLGTIETYLSMFGGNVMKLEFGLQQLYNAFMLRMIYKRQITIDYAETQDGEKRKLFRIEQPVMPPKGDDVTKVMGRQYLRSNAIELDRDLVKPHTDEAYERFRGYVNDAGIEYHLQKMLYDAAGEDHLLQPDELKDYVADAPLEVRPLATLLCMVTEECVKEFAVHKEDVEQVVGFLHYLRDFSLVSERNIEETSLWKEYLVYASFYGIADQVRKDMKKIAPDVATLDDFLRPEEFIREFEPLTDELDDIIKTAYLYQTKKEADMIYERDSAIEYESSSGGSGSSSYGGGGGHSGGGGSGVR